MTPNEWTLERAVKLCSALEQIAPVYGAHVALTGGCLYKDGPRKDVDVMFYCIRQEDRINEEGLLNAIEKMGIELGEQYGWVRKASFKGRSIDFFFPEAYPASSEQPARGTY